jgi:hypothetical protein
MSDKVNLFSFPEYQEGFDEDETREKLAKTLGVDEEKVETWFESTKPTIILKSTDEATGNKFVAAIRDCGGVCELQEVELMTGL